MKFLVSAIAMIALGCRGHHDDRAPAPTTKPISDAAIGDGSGSGSGSGAGSAADDSYTPAEFKAGMSRFKDVAVYVDGKPIGFLSFGELPITLKPTWVKHKANIDKPLGCKECKIWKWDEQRYYRFTDYLRAIGIEPKTVREIHVQGPKETNTIIATGRDLMKPSADDFTFYFGLHVRGKALPHVPMNFGNGLDPDKITAVMIYIAKTPPTLDGGGFVLDGRPVDGIPYFGEPLRGGVRIYLDDKLAAIIKRSELDVSKAQAYSNGTMTWKMAEFLKSRGVDTSHVVEAWVIRNDMREEKFPIATFSGMTFEAPSKSGKSSAGAVLLGDQKIVANAIALHTHAIQQSDLPVIRPDEQD